MKKLILLFTLIMALCVGSIAHAEDAISEALEYLSAAGISFEYEEETIQTEEKVTRAVFAQSIVKLLNMTDRVTDTVYYHDVSEDHWAFNDIGVLTEAGVITGTGDKYFNPDAYITRDQATAMVVSALGFGLYAENVGGFPEGYKKVASDLSILKNCSRSTDLTLGDMLIMLRNALDANISKLIFTDKAQVFEKAQDENVLSYYHEKYYGKGVITACDGVDLDTAATMAEGFIVIDGIRYASKISGLLDIIGTRVEFMYDVPEDSDGERRILWIKSIGGSEFLDIKKNSQDSFNKITNTFKYQPDGRETTKTIHLSGGLIVIYNGAVARGSVDHILNQDKYNVRFINTDSDREYDIAIVWHYQNMIMGAYDSVKEIIYDKYDDSKSLDVSDDRFKITIDGNAEIEQLQEGDILSYCESEDGSLLKISVSKRTQDVTAKYISLEDAGRTFFTEEGEFLFYDPNDNTSVVFGESVRLYLDINGYIAYVDRLKVGGFPVYLINVKYNDLDDELIIKTLDYDGKVVKRSAYGKVGFDGQKKKSIDIFAELAPARVTKQQVLVIQIDENNNITSIDTTTLGYGETDDNSLTLVESSYKGYYKHHGAYFPKYIFASDAVMFYPPFSEIDKGDDRNYLVKGCSDLGNNELYEADVYRYSKDNGYVNLVVLRSGNIGTSTSKYYSLVEEIKTAMNEDGEVVEKIICRYQGNQVEYLTIPEYSARAAGIVPGDIVAMVMNTAGKVKELQRKYEYGSVYTTTNYMTPHPDSAFHRGYVHSKVGNIMRIKYEGTDFESAFVVPSGMITVYDESERDKVRKGTMGDLTPDAKIVFQTVDENPVLLVVYK